MDQFDELHGNTATTFLFAKKKKNGKKKFKPVCQIKKKHLDSL